MIIPKDKKIKQGHTILMILISIQLLDEVVNSRKSCGARDK